MFIEKRYQNIIKNTKTKLKKFYNEKYFLLVYV